MDNLSSASQTNKYADQMNLVERIAHKVKSEMVGLIDVEDLIQTGMIGLLEARNKYDPKYGAKFETYAGIRIRGSMLDSIRGNDCVPRDVRRKSRKIKEAIHKIQNRKLSPATDKEIAEEAGMEICEYIKIITKAAHMNIYFEEELSSTDSSLRGEKYYNPELSYTDIELKNRFAEVIRGMPKRMQTLLNLHYHDNMNLKKISKILGISTSRCSQIHRETLEYLRNKLLCLNEI